MQGAGNADYFTTDMLNNLVGMTEFVITGEAEGLPYWASHLVGMNMGEYVRDVRYEYANGNLSVSGSIAVDGNLVIPEPATATLSLMALTLLAARRRRRYDSAA